LIALINGKMVYEDMIYPLVYQFTTSDKPLSVFEDKKGLSKGRSTW